MVASKLLKCFKISIYRMEGDIPTEYPNYLNKNFFIKCLQQGLDEKDTDIKNVDIRNGCNAGDNYVSFIYRIKIEFDSASGKNRKVQFLVKSIPTDGDRRILEEIKVYLTEKHMYVELISRIEQILNIRIAPKYIYATEDPIQTIVLQDLQPLGYSVADRVVGLDETQCQLVMEKLGTYHAASMHLLSKVPSVRENLKNELYDRNTAVDDIFLINYERNLKKAAEMVADMTGFEHFASKLLAICECFPEIVYNSFNSKNDEIKVINHGDVWINNMMFKYNEKSNPVDLLLIDFSDAFIGNPAFDINSFFISSVQLNVLKKKEELIEKFYYPAFKSTLESLKEEEIPSLSHILEEIREHELYSLFIFFGDFPLTTLPKEHSSGHGFDELNDEKEAIKKMEICMKTERFVETMKYNLKYFEELNVFENAINSMKR